jgi:flagellar basal-body rod protein FlgB
MLEGSAGKSMIDFDRDTAFAQKMLDVLSMRTKTAIHNIANQNVPGFKRSEVRFEDLLREAESTGRGDITTVVPEVVRDDSGAPGQNNVVLMDELAVLGKVSLLHDVMSRRAGSYFSTLNKAIFGR